MSSDGIGRGFDLCTALPLAKTAFAAYNTPIDKQASQNYDIKDVTVSFVDRTFLMDNFYGLLDIKIHRAAKLRASGFFNAPPNAFAVLSAEWPSLCARTRARRFTSTTKSTDPIWETATLRAPIRDPASDKLHVQLYDKDMRDQELGSAVLRLSDLVGKPEQLITLQLSGLGANQAATSTVTLSCRLRSFAQCSAGDLDSVSLVDTVPPEQQPGEGAAEGIADAFKIMGAGGDNNSVSQKPVYSWDDVCRVAGGEAAEELLPLVFLECWDTDTQAWLFRNVTRRKLVLAFRGTEKMRDWMTNFQLIPAKPHELLASRPKPTSGEVQVHNGFLGAYRSVRKAMNAIVQTVTGGLAQPPDRAWRLLVTGHSLGGALATLAAYDLAVQRWEYEQQTKRPTDVSLVMYNFGSPRVGNKAFMEDFNALLPNAWRLTNKLDVVTSVPTLGIHVGTAVQLGPQDRLMFNPPEVPPWDKIRSGQGVNEHLDYLSTFFRAVQATLLQAPKPLSRL
ncbi:hypothetical protein PLESTB_000166500 [Pleodorina starrii]|uniref:C2 domain-containing protein n=1 Tax=Pleodorina starrii TaxID=330485 RepID=A0A9W6BC61_9CHLO|nr:hypothetical protein PLESTM_002065100 [Pleodorina starrii]GLC48952.1 hypothetical protein PLESTB_000166500 [Pleodorina starrii]GLC72679.1 hypothetical protein PLESTF_001277700 [Pleodorina starrii]